MIRSRGSRFFGAVRCGAAGVALLLVLGGVAMAAGPSMMAGFPLRAGANVMLMWMPYPGAALYNVYRGEAPGGPYKKVAEVPMNMHTDMNVPTDKSFYYVVKAVIGGKEGDPSPEVVMKGLEPMVTPKFIGVLITPDNKVALRWEANSKAAFYNLYRSDTEKGEYALLSSGQDSKYTDGKAELGKTYYYKVTAISSANVESPKGDKPEIVKVEKKAVEGGGGPEIKLVNWNVEVANTYDVDGSVYLRSPSRMRILGDGSFLVVDGRGFVQHVDKEMKWKKDIGKQPDDYKEDWGSAFAVEFNPKKGEVFITYPSVNHIRVFDLESKLLREFSLPPPPDPKMVARPVELNPYDLAFGVDGLLWVLDGGYFQMVALDPETGKEVKRYKSLARYHPDRKEGDPSIESPVAIAVNRKSGDIYVVESSMQRVSRFNKAGDLLGRFGGRGTAPGKFQIPSAVSIDPAGTVYVGDMNMASIQAFLPNGEYAATITLPKKKDPAAKLRAGNSITGIAVAGPKGEQIFYSDLNGQKVVEYKRIP